MDCHTVNGSRAGTVDQQAVERLLGERGQAPLAPFDREKGFRFFLDRRLQRG
jgi:hypothetical protein